MNLELQRIYDQLINTVEGDKHICFWHEDLKPNMLSGILTPESQIQVSSSVADNFKLDKSGMHKVLSMLEETIDEDAQRNLLALLTKVYLVADKYLGGKRNII